MTPDLMTLALLVGLFVGVLAIFQLVTAIRHDQVVTAAPAIVERDEVVRQIEVKRAEFLDIEADLKKRREDLANIATVQAEYDGLLRQRDELLAEHAQLGERRAEVLAMRAETEEGFRAKSEVERDLREKSEELASVQDKLDRAEAIVGRINDLTKEREGIEASLANLREEASALRDASEKVELLRLKAETLERDAARLSGLAEAEQEKFEDYSARTAAARSEYASTQSGLAGLAAQAETAHAEIRQAEGRLRVLDDTRGELEVKIAALTAEIARLASQSNSDSENLRDISTSLGVVRAEIDQLRDEKTIELANFEASQAEIRQAEAKIRSLEESRIALEARVAHLQAEASRLAPSGGGGQPVDPLRDLAEPPEVLKQLRSWPNYEPRDEVAALYDVNKRMESVGLEYSGRVLRAFHTAMKVNETSQITVLAGISGTGKSQLPRQYAAAMGIGFLQVPVQPRWDSPQDLMGFYNYIEGRFRATDMARALYHLDGFNGPSESRDLQDRMLMVLLDEMNLARVEYYFSDFLSRLESRPRSKDASQKDARKDAEIEIEIPNGKDQSRRIFPGYNLLFAGTMNEDESTQSLSDKVVDRANVMRFAAPKSLKSNNAIGQVAPPHALSRQRWTGWLRSSDSLGSDKIRVEEQIAQMVDFMHRMQRPMGHRMGRAIMAYATNYPVGEGYTLLNALADQVEMRLLPKLRGVEMDKAETTLADLADYVSDKLQDVSLAEAIKTSAEQAISGSGQFVWRGVTR